MIDSSKRIRVPKNLLTALVLTLCLMAFLSWIIYHQLTQFYVVSDKKSFEKFLDRDSEILAAAYRKYPGTLILAERSIYFGTFSIKIVNLSDRPINVYPSDIKLLYKESRNLVPVSLKNETILPPKHELTFHGNYKTSLVKVDELDGVVYYPRGNPKKGFRLLF